MDGQTDGQTGERMGLAQVYVQIRSRFNEDDEQGYACLQYWYSML